MKAKIMDLFGPFSFLIAQHPAIASFYRHLPRGFKTYTGSFQPTFSHTNIQKVVGISSVAWEIGWFREVYGLNMLPGFQKNVDSGFNRYILKTVASSFVYGPLSFGKKIRVEVSVGEYDEIEGRFSLSFRFIDKAEVLCSASQQIFYVPTADDVYQVKQERKEFFRLIKALSTGEGQGFAINSKMKEFVALKSRQDFVYEYPFSWDLRTTTEEGNTNHASFVEILHSGLEHYLLSLNPKNGQRIADGSLKVKELEICYLKDFHIFEKAKIRFFKEVSGVAAVFLREDERGGAALAKIKVDIN